MRDESENHFNPHDILDMALSVILAQSGKTLWRYRNRYFKLATIWNKLVNQVLQLHCERRLFQTL